jgi:N-acetylmuramoyl-L-alanine amidase
LTDSKVSVRDIKQANYFVLKESHVPALLLELGFMTNAEDLQKMNSPEYLEKICEALTKSILLYSK